MKTILIAANYAGVISFAFQGTTNAYKKTKNPFVVLLCAFLTTYGGGMIFRDIFFLGITPGVFSNGKEVLLAMLVSMMALTAISIFHNNTIAIINSSNTKMIISVLDSLGLGSFICCGVEKGMAYNMPLSISLLCGIATGIGGGIIASLIRGDNISSIISRDKSYRLITLICSVTYVMIQHNDVDSILGQNAIIIQAMLLCSIVNPLVYQPVLSLISIYVYINSFTIHQIDTPFYIMISNSKNKNRLQHFNKLQTLILKLRQVLALIIYSKNSTFIHRYSSL